MSAERQDLAVVTIYSIVVGLLSLALPVAVQSLVNTVAFGTVLQPLVVLSILVFAALAFAAILQCLRLWVVEKIQRRVFSRLADQVGDRLLRVRLEAFDRQNGPELVNRFLDVVTVQKSVSLLLVDGLSLIMQVAIGMLLLAVYHPYLLAFDIVLLLLIVIVLFGLGRGAVRTSIAESHAKYDALAWLEEIARHHSAFRSRVAETYARNRTHELVRGYLRERAGHFKILMRQTAGTLTLQACAISALLGMGGWLVVQGQLTLGQLVAAELVVSMIVTSLVKFGKSLESFYDLQAAMDKLGYLTDLPVERTSGEPVQIPGAPAALRLRGVTFAYPGQLTFLSAPPIEIPPGGRVALHGLSGSGKSTFLDMMYALRNPSSGSLELDGIDYREYLLPDLRDRIVLVRDVDVFPGTVLDNVRLGTRADPLEVRRVLEKVGLLEQVSALPDGINTRLSTGGPPLSPSQAFRLVIARALLAKPRLLLLDEVLDQIQDLDIRGPLIHTLFDSDAPWTLVLTTERNALWPLCDQVFAFRAGRVEPHAVEPTSLTAAVQGGGA